ncbi:MAG: hypothetical protein U0871_01950 [Gemmataceae bacterium]
MADVLPLPSRPAGSPARKRRTLQPLAVDARGLTQLLPFGLRTIRAMDSAGKLPAPVRVGGRVLWRVPEIRAWLKAGAPDRAGWEALKAATRK